MKERKVYEEEFNHDSLVTTSTYHTFVPPLSDTVSVSGLTVNTNIEQSEDVRVLTLDTLNVNATIPIKFIDKKEEKKSVMMVISVLFCFFLFLILLAGIGFTLLIKKEDKENKIVPDFCAELSLTDAAMRDSLAENFDASLFENRVLIYGITSMELGCLPENAFSKLNQSQRETVKTLEGVVFVGMEILKIHVNAFEEVLVKNFTRLFFQSNNLTILPDKVFQPFKGLNSLGFKLQSFVTLNNNLFGEISPLTIIEMSSMKSLTSFPEFMKETPNLVTLSMSGAESLVNANIDAFKNLTSLETIVLSATTPVLVDLEVAQLAAVLDVDVGIFVIT